MVLQPRGTVVGRLGTKRARINEQRSAVMRNEEGGGMKVAWARTHVGL